MIEDKRLFSFNNPIGRMWFFINICLLSLLTASVYFVMQYAAPFVNTSFKLPFKILIYFTAFLLFVTYAALLHRRVYDITGSKDSKSYSSFSSITGILSLMLAAGLFNKSINPGLHDVLDILTVISALSFLLITVIILFIPGKSVSNKEKQD